MNRYVPRCNCCGRTLLGCPCTNIPSTLYFKVGNQTGGGTDPGPNWPATLVFGPQPADVPYAIDNPGYYSTTTFTNAGGTRIFRYYFTCQSGFYSLQTLTTTSSPDYGGSGVDVSVTPWIAGATRGSLTNTCSPWSFKNPSNNLTWPYDLSIETSP